jgi:predicted PurR-regulated permease PerM
MDDKASVYFAGIFLIFLGILAVFMVTFIDNTNNIITTLYKENVDAKKEISKLNRELHGMRLRYEQERGN